MAKQLATRLLLVTGSLLAALLIFEIGLRIAGFSYPVLAMADRYRGWALRPGAEGWWNQEGEAYIRINSDGLRDREHNKEKPAGTLRIAVLGDSYAEALQVPMENAFWAVMEHRLQECKAFGGQKVEVINFGVSGYGTAQELITLRQQAWAYSPDIVVLAFATDNDVRDNSRALNQFPEIPYYIYRGDELVLDTSSLEARNNSLKFRLQQSALGRLFNWMRDRSRVIQLVDKSRSRFIRRPVRQERSASARNGKDIYAELGLDSLIFRAPDDPAWKEAWRVTEGLVTLMRDEVEEKGARFFVVTLSSGIQVHPDPAVRRDFMRQLGVDDLFYPNLRIQALCEREGIPALDLAPALLTYAEQHQVFMHGFGQQPGLGHWNERGHRVAGKMVAQKLCEARAD